MARKGYRRPPVWPSFVFERLTQAGIAQLERDYYDFKNSNRLPRVTRISAEDYATVFVDRVVAGGRGEFLKLVA